MKWEDVPERVSEWSTLLQKAASDVQGIFASQWTPRPVGVYASPDYRSLAVFAPDSDAATRSVVQETLEKVAGDFTVRSVFLSPGELEYVEVPWVKLASSPTLHRLGEWLNFFPGQYPGGVPNHPSPLASMLTSGVLGAGLGYGAGRLAGGLMPHGYGDNLGRLGLVLGGAFGAAPGLGWGLTNRSVGRDFNDPSLLQDDPENPSNYPNASNGTNAVPPRRTLLDPLTDSVNQQLGDLALPKHFPKISADLLRPEAVQAIVKAAETFGTPYTPPPPTASDVNINHLGQVLWDSGASPGLAASTMGAMYAAQQLPDSRSQPGIATGHQLGQLAARAAGDYIRGRLVGAAINAAIGTPFSSGAFGVGNAALGVIGAVVPRLFGA